MLNSGGGIWNDVKPEVGGPNSWNVDIFVQVLKELVGATVCTIDIDTCVFVRFKHTKLYCRCTRVEQLLKSLLSLPVRYCIIFNKICTISFQVLSCKQPLYFHSLPTPVRKLSSFDHLVVIYFLSIKLVLILGLWFLLWVHLFFGICFFLVLNQLKILLNCTVSYRHTFKTLPIHHSSLVCQPVHDNWNCLLTLRLINPFVLMCLRA